MRAALAFFILFGVLPLGAGLVYAFLYATGIIGLLNTGFTLQNWYNAVISRSLWQSISLSLGISLLVSALAFFAAVYSWYYSRLLLEKRIPQALLRAPLAVPPIVASFVSYQWWSNSGVFARIFQQLGWIQRNADFPELVNDAAYFGVVVTLFYLSFPFVLLYLIDQARRMQLGAYLELAATLGASEGQIRRKLLFPMLFYRMLPTLVLYAVFLFGAYEAPLVLGRQSPAMISVLIHEKLSRYNLSDIPLAYAYALVYAGILMLLLGVFWRWNEKTD